MVIQVVVKNVMTFNEELPVLGQVHCTENISLKINKNIIILTEKKEHPPISDMD
jgi:hypothetical protein